MGLSNFWLGPVLFIMGMGAAIGAKVTELFPEKRYRRIAVIATIGVAIAFSTIFSGNYYLMIIGGFIGGFSDNFIQVRSDILLNTMIPSDQRATLMSVNSFAFSMVMIVLSPIFGILFSF